MSGELQSIPARHGTATFVPKGQTIKIINTYGKQVVDTWIFGLHDAPDRGEDDEQAEAEKAMSRIEEEGEKAETEKETDVVNEAGKETETASEAGKVDEAEEKGDKGDKDEKDSKAEEAPSSTDTSKQQPNKASWSSYIPSLRRNQQPSSSKQKPDNSADHSSKQPQSGEKRTWASYFPSGQSYTSYLPSRSTLSALTAAHERDPTKSYAEQLYDFSKTPVGAASLSVASGSGTASSLYAAYSAYTKTAGAARARPPMEYLSLAHTRDVGRHTVPREGDVLMSNLRAELATFVEDTTEAGHDALLPACDAPFYAALGVRRPAEHGSCAENLVLALQELNERAGLMGAKAVGADVSVNSAPAPFHLFMHTAVNDQGEIEVREPKGTKRGVVRLKAEKDIVVVMSACPCEEGPVNGGKCMAANFVVEGVSPESMQKKPAKTDTPPQSSKTSTKTKTQQASKGVEAVPPSSTDRRKSAPKLDRAASEQRRATAVVESKPPVQRKPSAQRKPSTAPLPERKETDEEVKNSDKKDGEQSEEQQTTKATEKRKPKKLERRGQNQNDASKGEVGRP